jgi:hypothetical protein
VEFFSQAPGAVSMSTAELGSVCGPGATAYDAAVQACPEPQRAKCLNARQEACKALTSTRLDTLAQCYRATDAKQLPLPTTGQAGAEALGAGAVSIVAQGAADFLMTRAEQEVSLFAATELNKAICKQYGDAYFPKACTLLKEADETTLPIGLGVLRRAIIEDMRALPKHILLNVFNKLDPQQKNHACSLDVGYALGIGLWEQRELTVLFKPDPDPTKNGHLLLHRYAVLSAEQPCTTLWSKIETAAKQPQTAGSWNTLYGAIAASSKAAPDPQKVGRVVRAAIAVLKQLSGNAADVALDEAGEIALAIVEEDWIGFVFAAASAKHLGPILLCKQKVATCTLDIKARASLRLIGDVASAQSSDGVASALERFAAPLGSWRRKYEGLSLMLQGYVGARVAHEWIKGDVKSGWVLAPSLALGLEVAGPLWSHGRLGFFAQVVDVGNVSSVRFASEEDENLASVEVAPDITAVQLLAPGGYVTFAPWKAPFAISVGAEWIPELRSVVGGERKSAFHVGAALLVDTPILEIAHD